MIRLRHALLIPTLTLAMAGALTGCGEEPSIQTYEAPKDQPPPTKTAQSTGDPALATSNPPSNPAATPIQWTLPEGWTADADPQPPRLASFTVAAETGSDVTAPAELTITRFPGDVGGELANINRWRRQLELPPISDPAEQTSQSISLGAYPCTVYRIGRLQPQPEDPAIVVATILDSESSWFIKMTGTNQQIADQAENFIAFLVSLRLPLAAPPKPDATGESS